MPQRIQRKRTKGWRMPDNTVCVDRTTEFGNPFPVRKSTSRSAGKESAVWIVGTWTGPAMWIRDSEEEATDISVKAFSAWIGQPVRSALRERAKLALRGKNLACWCALTDKNGNRVPCHADILLELANRD